MSHSRVLCHIIARSGSKFRKYKSTSGGGKSCLAENLFSLFCSRFLHCCYCNLIHSLAMVGYMRKLESHFDISRNQILSGLTELNEEQSTTEYHYQIYPSDLYSFGWPAEEQI